MSLSCFSLHWGTAPGKTRLAPGTGVLLLLRQLWHRQQARGVAGGVCSSLTQGSQLGSPPPRVGATAASPQFSVRLSALPQWENIHRMAATQQPGHCLLSKGLAPNNTFLPPGEGFCPTEAGQEPEGQFLCFAKNGTWAYPTPNPSGKRHAGKVHTVETKRNDLDHGGGRTGNQIQNKTPLHRVQQKSPPSTPAFPM